MNDLNGYKIAQIGGAILFVVMLFLLTVVGFYRITTAITWVALMFVAIGIFYGAAKLDEASRERERDEEMSRKLNDTSRDG